MNKTNMLTLSCLGLLMTEASHASWASHLDAIVNKRPTTAVPQHAAAQLPTPHEILRTRAAPVQQIAQHISVTPTLQQPRALAQTPNQPATPAPQTQLLNQIAELQAVIQRMQADAEILAEGNEFSHATSQETVEELQLAYELQLRARESSDRLREGAERDLSQAERDFASNVSELAQRLDQKDETIADLHDEITALRQNDSTHNVSRGVLYRENITLDEMLTEAKQEKDALLERIALLEKNIEEQKTPADFDKERLERENLALAQIMQVLEIEREELQSELKGAKDAQKKLKIEQANKEIHAAKIAALTEDRKALKAKNDELNKLISRLKTVDGMVEDENNRGNVRLGAILALAQGVEELRPLTNLDAMNKSIHDIEAMNTSVEMMQPVANNVNRRVHYTARTAVSPVVTKIPPIVERIRDRRSVSVQTNPENKPVENDHELSMLLANLDFSHGPETETVTSANVLSNSETDLVKRALAGFEESETSFTLDDSVANGSNDPSHHEFRDNSFDELSTAPTPIKDRNAYNEEETTTPADEKTATIQDETPLSDKENGTSELIAPETLNSSPNPFFLQKIDGNESFTY